MSVVAVLVRLSPVLLREHAVLGMLHLRLAQSNPFPLLLQLCHEHAQLGIEQPVLLRISRLLQANHEVPRLGLRGVVLPSHCLELVECVQPAPTKRLGARSRCAAARRGRGVTMLDRGRRDRALFESRSSAVSAGG